MLRPGYILLALLWSVSSLLSAQLRINEVNALNTNGKNNPATKEPGDWIELYNPGSGDLDISHYYLSDDPSNPLKWRFPMHVTVPGQGYQLVWPDGSGLASSYLCPNFKLNVAGECLLLSDSMGQSVDSLSYPRMYENHSYGYDGDGETLFFKVPSPGSWNNSVSAYRKAGKPLFSIPAGVYPEGLALELLSDTVGSIRYTSDGSIPGKDSPLYSDPINITQTRVIRAQLIQEGYEAGDVVTSTYLVHEAFTLPVVSLSTTPANLFDNQIGIYVTGTNGIMGYCAKEPHNYNQNWERPMSFEFFDREGQRQFFADAGVKIHGGCSRSAPMKSLAIFARGKYGFSSLDYPFFTEKKNKNSFEGVILRNGGNDFGYAFMRDGVVQSSVSPVMDLDYQAMEQVQVFMNGEYWGIHNLREKVNEHWVESNYDIPVETIDFLKNKWGVFAGTRDKWKELQSFMEENSLAIEANYQWVASQLDIPSYQDYLITQLYFANQDWPGNNLKQWRKHSDDGRWRYILFDTEMSMGMYSKDPSRNMFEFATSNIADDWPNPSWATLIIRSLLENPGFREEFVRKYQVHLNTTFKPDRIIALIDSFQNNIIDLYPDHAAKWGIQNLHHWLLDVEDLRVFSRERPAWVWKHMLKFFELDETAPVSITSTLPDARIMANGVELPPEGLNGRLCRGSKLDLDYPYNPGYRFSHWEVSLASGEENTLLEKESEWCYNDSSSYPGDEWKQLDYDDASWNSGPGPLGYGEPFISTTLSFGSDASNKRTTCWFRKDIELENPENYSDLTFKLMRDDGIVVYVNGQEAFRDNMPVGTITASTFATTWVGGEDEGAYFEYQVDPSLLKQGSNCIAVEVHQSSLRSSDLVMDMEITATSPMNEALILTENPLSLDIGGGTEIIAVSERVQLDLDLYINEIMASNKGVVLDEQGQDGDWIEIHNAGDSIVDMAGLWFTDDLARPDNWQVPGGWPSETSVDPGGYLLFFADGNPLAGVRHLDFKLSAGGEALGLSYLNGDQWIWIDSLSFGPQYSDISTGRWPDGNSNWVMLEYSAGSANVRRTVAIHEPPALDFSLYPNPASGHAFLKVSSHAGMLDGKIEILLSDLQGRVLLRGEEYAGGGSAEFRLELQGLDEGMYLVLIRSGQHCKSTRLIIGGR